MHLKAKRGYSGRFGAGLPRVNDGSLLFLQHLISKMQPIEAGGSRIAIVFNASPLFTGDAGSGESEIRRWIIENDWLDAIVALPDQLFYNTGIYTYIWIVSNRKEDRRRGKVQLIDAVSFFQKMRRSLGKKRNVIADQQIDAVTALYQTFEEDSHSKIFDNAELGYRRITVDRPLRQNYQAGSDRIKLLAASTAFQRAIGSKRQRGHQLALTIEQNDDDAQQEALIALSSMGDEVYLDRASFEEALTHAFRDAKIPLNATLKTAIVNGLAERDERADPVMSKSNHPEPDPELRDSEHVPLKMDINDYFLGEVIPYVPDAWISESVTDPQDGGTGKIGYEIPFTRYFYEYKPSRPLKEIDHEIKVLESDILALLQEVTA